MYHCVYANATEIGRFLDPRSRNEALFLSQREDEASGAIRSLSYPVTTKLLLKLDVEGVALDRVNDRIRLFAPIAKRFLWILRKIDGIQTVVGDRE